MFLTLASAASLFTLGALLGVLCARVVSQG
jgi:hypothetical protein